MQHETMVAAILGFAAVAAAQQAGAKPARGLDAAWRQALAQAAADKAPVLAFVLPPADAKADPKVVERLGNDTGMMLPPPIVTARDALLRWLLALQRDSAGGAGAAMALAVAVVATPATCGARPGETIVLLGADGRRIDGFVIAPGDTAAFVERIGKRLWAAEALANRAADVPQRFAADLELVQAHQVAANELQRVRTTMAQGRLLAALPAVAPALIAPPSTEHPLPGVALELAALLALREPLGTELEVVPGDPCPPCGMARVPDDMRAVLKLIGP